MAKNNLPSFWEYYLGYHLERKKDGRNWRAGTQGKGGSFNQPDHCAGRAAPKRTASGAFWAALNASQSTGKGPGVVLSDLAPSDPNFKYDLMAKYIHAYREVFYVPEAVMLKRRLSGKWAPPWMQGELGQPNNAKTWTPRLGAAEMASDGVIAGEIIGWRAWHWNGKRLRSIFVDYEWPINGEHAVGEVNRGYGIHAYMDRKRVYVEYQNILKDIFIGQVAMWGDVVVFESGYTAEFGRIVSLESPIKERQHLIPKIKDLYQID